MEVLDELEHPKPLRELIYGTFDAYRVAHPWVADHNIRPKSVARDLFERAMTFPEYVAHYGVARSEGLLLRYLTDAYKAMLQTVPEEAKTPEVHDLVAWLGETVRQVDSSLLDEWERLRAAGEGPVDPALVDPGSPLDGRAALPAEPPRLTANPRALRVMVRNEAFRRVELLARRRWDDLAALEPASADGFTAARFEAAMAAYFAEHDEVGVGADARGPTLFQLEEGTGAWVVRQVLDDPAGDHDWALVARVDLAASDAEGHPVVETVHVGRWADRT